MISFLTSFSHLLIEFLLSCFLIAHTISCFLISCLISHFSSHLLFCHCKSSHLLFSYLILSSLFLISYQLPLSLLSCWLCHSITFYRFSLENRILLAHSCLYYYLLSLQYTLLHIILLHIYFLFFYSFYFLLQFFPYLYLCIFSCVCISYNCTVHGLDLTYISLLVIFCIIVYVTNTILNLFSYHLLSVEKGAALTLEEIKTLLIKMMFRLLSRPSSDIKNSSTKQCLKPRTHCRFLSAVPDKRFTSWNNHGKSEIVWDKSCLGL